MRVIDITSTKNDHFKRWQSLTESRGIKKHQQCLVSGSKLVSEITTHHPDLIDDILLKDNHKPLVLPPARTYKLTTELFKEIDVLGTGQPILVLKATPLKRHSLEDPPQGLEVLCPLGDPQNVGAIIRSCEAFGVSRVILLESAAHPFLPKALRAAAGSTFRVPLALSENMECVKGPLIGLDRQGESIKNFNWPKNARLYVGEEGQGLPEDLTFDYTLSIPMEGQVESLNAAMALSVALFHRRLISNS